MAKATTNKNQVKKPVEDPIRKTPIEHTLVKGVCLHESVRYGFGATLKMDGGKVKICKQTASGDGTWV